MDESRKGPRVSQHPYPSPYHFIFGVDEWGKRGYCTQLDQGPLVDTSDSDQ